MGKDVISKIAFVCSDMWEPYLKLIRENCSEALHILDRFHIVANMNKALDNVRAEETSRMKREGRAPGPQEIPLAAAPPQRESRRRPALPVARSPPLQPQDRPCLPSQGSLSATLGISFARLGRPVPRRVVPPDYAIPDRTHEEDRPSLRNHRELILNDFRAQKLLSSGVVEGLNNKDKVTMRKSYGFRTYYVLELALYHSLGKLPEPESTHDFLLAGQK